MIDRRPTTVQALTGALRTRAELFAWLGTVLLAVNLLAAALLPLPAAGAAETAGAIEICTPDGMIWIDAGGHRLNPGGHPVHGVDCQFCLPLLHAAFSPAAAPIVPVPALGVLRGVSPAPAGAPAAIRPRHPGQPRAPPAV